MNLDRYDITAVIHMHLIRADSTTADIEVALGYRASDPFVIEAEFAADGQTARWVLARELFAQGLGAGREVPAGLGDVRVWRDEDPEYLLIALTGTRGTALVAAPAEQVERFVDETQVLVPVSAQSDRVDAALDDLVASIFAS